MIQRWRETGSLWAPVKEKPGETVPPPLPTTRKRYQRRRGRYVRRNGACTELGYDPLDKLLGITPYN